MQLDWRSCLDSLHVSWRDRGKNTSAGNISICCPFCRDDAGFHMAISEEKEAYYCWRQPRKHSGKSFDWLLQGLGVHYRETQRVINRYRIGKSSADRSERHDDEPARGNPAADVWAGFSSANRFKLSAEYLRYRGYPDPIYTAARYDLRATAMGQWAARLLIPTKIDGEIVSWTGRALTDRLEPKYRNEAEGERGAGLIYVPDAAAFKSGSRAIIVEGPLDALKLAHAMPSVGAIALMGKASSPLKLMRIANLIKTCSRIDVCLDDDASLNDRYGEIKDLCGMGLGIHARPQRLSLPDYVKDPGSMEFEEIREWLREQ